MVVTDKGKVLKAISAREKPVSAREDGKEAKGPAKERWKAVAKGGRVNNIKESSTKEQRDNREVVNKGQLEGKQSMKVDDVKNGDVKKEALAKEVVSVFAKKPSKMNWKKAMAKQSSSGGRNGYKPIMTDKGFVVVRKDSIGGLKPVQNSGKKENEMIKPMISECNNVTKVKENSATGSKDLLGNSFDEVDAGSEFKQMTEEAGEKVDHQKEEKEEKDKKEEKEGKNERKKDQLLQPAQRPSTLKLRSQHKQQDQGSQDQKQQMSNEVENKQQDKDQVFNNKEQHAKDSSSSTTWMKEKEVEEPHVSLSQRKTRKEKEVEESHMSLSQRKTGKEKEVEESRVSLPQRGWTSWEEMAQKKCPTKNLIVFN